MKLYCGIDLRSNNSVVVILDEANKVIYQKKLSNNLPSILEQLSVYQGNITAIVIESTFNWYWLVDWLMEGGCAVKLVNTTAVQTYSIGNIILIQFSHQALEGTGSNRQSIKKQSVVCFKKQTFLMRFNT